MQLLWWLQGSNGATWCKPLLAWASRQKWGDVVHPALGANRGLGVGIGPTTLVAQLVPDIWASRQQWGDLVHRWWSVLHGRNGATLCGSNMRHGGSNRVGPQGSMGLCIWQGSWWQGSRLRKGISNWCSGTAAWGFPFVSSGFRQLQARGRATSLVLWDCRGFHR